MIHSFLVNYPLVRLMLFQIHKTLVNLRYIQMAKRNNVFLTKLINKEIHMNQAFYSKSSEESQPILW